MTQPEDRMITRSREKLEFPQVIARLLGLTSSQEGKALCEQLLPTPELAVAESRQQETEDTLEILLRKGQAPLQGLHRIRPSLDRLKTPGVVLGTRELMQIGSFLEAVERLAAFAPAGEGEVNRFYQLLFALIPQAELKKDLQRSILGENELADQASAELASIRQASRRSQSQIRVHLDRLLKSAADALQEQIITQRNDRYVVPVKIEQRSRIPGIVHDTSQSGQTLFIEPLAVVEENNRIRELKVQEEREIERILKLFSQRIAAVREDLLEDVELLARADFFWAKARLAQQMKASRPLLNNQGRINLKQARHPHIPAEEVVPIDFYVGENFRTLLITGPNTGGKTVSLKTCGLLNLMAASGLQIPAAHGSTCSVFRQILADIGDEQSIEQSLSTFSSHMRNIVEITEMADQDTLVLTDELGSGTDPSEGAALAVAILEDLRMSGCVTVATTHYKELKVYALQTDDVENAAAEFDIDTLKPTYKLLIGVPGSSNAFIISRKLGLREGIIERAKRELTTENIRFENVLADVDRQRAQTEQLLREAQEDRAKARAARQQAEAEEAKILKSKQDILQTAREESRQNLRRQTQEVDALVKDINRRIQEGGSAPVQDAEALRQLLRGELNDIESEIGQETLKQLKSGPALKARDRWEVGDTAFAPALQLEGKIMTEPDNKGQVFLRSGQLQVSVPVSGLVEPPSKREKKRETAAARPHSSVRQTKRMNFSAELKLIGKTTAEGIEILDHYLDDAVLAGAETVRIVHGKGTGALRKAVQDFLGRDSRIATWRQAAFGEGDAGVTIAELKMT